MHMFWEKGINNFSYNSIVSYSGVSKPSLYRLVGNLDDVQSKSLIYYYDNILKHHRPRIENAKNFYSFMTNNLLNIEKQQFGKANEKEGVCFFTQSRILKHQLGKKTQKVIDTIDKRFISSLKILIKKSMNNKELSKDTDIEELALFSYNLVTHFIYSLLNASNKREISITRKYYNRFIKTYVN